MVIAHGTLCFVVNMAEIDDTRRLDDSVSEQAHCVFYCLKCREIFGDSLSTVRVDTDLNSVSLQMVTNALELTKECKTSVTGSDKGSSYHIIKCKSCKSSIGRYYRTTPKSLDCIREIYTLDLCNVQSYHLGRCVSNNNEHLVDPLQRLGETIFKTQSIVLSLNERVEKLESFLEDVDSSDENVQQLDSKSKQKKRKLN